MENAEFKQNKPTEFIGKKVQMQFYVYIIHKVLVEH